MNQHLLALNYFSVFPHLSQPSLNWRQSSPFSRLDFGIGNVVTGLICPDHWSFLLISNKAVSLDLCVHWSGTFNFLQEYFFCIYNLTNRHKRPRFQPVSAFNVPSSLGLIISSLWFMVRDHDSSFHLNTLRPLLGHFVHVYSIVSDSWRPHGLWPASLLCSWTFQAILLEWVAISYSRGSSWPREWAHASSIGTSLPLCHLGFLVYDLQWKTCDSFFHLKTLRLLLGY